MKKNASHLKLIFTVIPISVLLISGIAFLSSRSDSEDACKENVALLEALENADIAATEKQLNDLRGMEASQSQDTQDSDDEPSIQALSTVQLKQAYRGSIIVGDSITESIVEYGYLDTDVVISKRGLRIDDADEQLDTAISLHPLTLFLAFGANDLELYEGNSQDFADAYRTKIEKIQAALPDTPVYINSILPVLQSAIDETPSLGYYREFNQALETVCQETGCTFIDNSFLVEVKENMYEPDGEHVIADYYPQWLTYMAETAGLI